MISYGFQKKLMTVVVRRSLAYQCLRIAQVHERSGMLVLLFVRRNRVDMKMK
jgi:hypothetical protein